MAEIRVSKPLERGFHDFLVCYVTQTLLNPLNKALKCYIHVIK